MTPEAERAFANLKTMEEVAQRLRLKKIEERANRPAYVRENIRTDIQVGMIAEDCALHIGVVTFCDPQADDVRIKSLFDDVERSCSLYHCGVVAQTPEQVELKTHLWWTGGMKALSDYYHAQWVEFD